MHICIFQTGEPLHIDIGNYRPMRAMLLADELLKEGNKVTIISSSFFHQRKIFRSKSFKKVNLQENFSIILIPSLGYKKHIGFKRLFDHIVLSINLYQFLRNNKKFKPDKVFIGYPPIESSFVIMNWAKKNNIPIMLDVKDNWPENFIEALPNFLKKFGRFLLFPYFILTTYIFNNADAVSSITKSFINWIKTFENKQNKTFSKSIYFVSPLVRKKIIFNQKILKEATEFWHKKGINIIEKKHFSFVGSLSNSFDFKFILNISNFLITKYPNYIFIICGTGDKYLELKQLFSNSPNVMLVGEIDKYKASILIKHSVASLAPYLNNQNFQNSIPNKVIESLENSVPFITNTQGELKKMIEEFDNGIFLDKDLKDIEKISSLIENKEFLNNLQRNSFKSYEALFNFEKTYQKIICNLKKI